MRNKNNKISIFDTSLRDGEQAPGASLNIFEKVEIAKQLIKLNVDIIEAGFPVSSKEQYESVKRISDLPEGPIVAALARSIEKDIKSAASALSSSESYRIHTFIGTSDIHIEGKFSNSRYGRSLNEKRQTVLKMACDAISMAKTFTTDVEFSPEDAGRTDIGFLVDIIEAVIASGATTVNIPDTTGYTMPLEFGEKISDLKKRVSNIDDAVISVHCHNDLGLAVANSLSAISSGARQVECTINGIGERAGNASMEEIVMALKVRSEYWDYFTEINTKEIYPTSRMVSSYTGIMVQPNKALVGDNAFAHESGIHQDGVLKNRDTYEIIDPESIGIKSNKIVLGRHSGRHGLKSRLSSLGYELSEVDLTKIYNRFLELADKKKEVFDDDLRVLMGDSLEKDIKYYNLDYLHVNIGTTTIPTAVVRINVNDKIFEESATGDGPVAACFRAVKRAVSLETDVKLEHYQVRSITSGKGALGEVLLRLKIENSLFSGRGISTDTIEASCKAYLDALNQFQKQEKLRNDVPFISSI